MNLTLPLGSAVAPALVVAGGLALGSLARADVIHVPADISTIQGAIDRAVDGDEIIVAPGTYHELITFLGKAIFLHSSDGPEVTMIDADRRGTVVSCHSGEGPDTVLEGFTITGGSAVAGAGLFITAASPTVLRCRFIDNQASDRGGGVYNCVGSPWIAQCIFRRNSADQNGGGVMTVGGAPVFLDCGISDNEATDGAGISHAVAINNFDSTLIMIGCRLTGNVASRNGGAVFNAGLQASQTQLVNCQLTGNTADVGGAVWIVAATTSVTNCTIVGNTGLTETAGIRTAGAAGTTVDISNCVFWDNQAGQADYHDDIQWEGGIISVRFCCLEGGWDGEGNIDADPLFVDLTSGDYRLTCESPCVSAGSNAALPADEFDLDGDGDTREIIPVDIRGKQRVGHCRVDIGAYESPFRGPDCNGNGAPDACDLLDAISFDCNENQVPDECDIADGKSQDVNGNAVPDECEPDCNRNGLPDDVDIADGTSHDNNGNGIPDECEPLLGDVDGDGDVDTNDLLLLLLDWGHCVSCDDCRSDFNSDCDVETEDLVILLGNWGAVRRNRP